MAQGTWKTVGNKEWQYWVGKHWSGSVEYSPGSFEADQLTSYGSTAKQFKTLAAAKSSVEQAAERNYARNPAKDSSPSSRRARLHRALDAVLDAGVGRGWTG